MPKKILIVDDERLITETLSGMLQLSGYQVRQALDGETALKIIQEDTPNLVLLDIKLPGINGLEVLKAIRKDYPKTFVLIMTGYDIEYKKKIEEIGADGFFVKPVLVGSIKEKIEQLFDKLEPKTDLPQKSAKTPPPESVKEEDIIPKAKLLLVEPREMLVDLMQDYFLRGECCQADYEIKCTALAQSLKHTDFLRNYQPDIILFDVALVGLYGEFATTLMDLPSPPKEVILFGDPATKWEDADTLIKRGALYVPTPLDLPYQLPYKEVLDRLAASLKRACIKHGLYRLKG